MTDSVACRSQKCRVQGGDTWPKCMGPNGCLRDQPPASTPVVVVELVPTRKVWKDKPKPVSVPPKPVSVKPKPGPKMKPTQPKPRTRKKASGRKSVSVGGKLFNKFKAAAEKDKRSMASIVEDETALFFSRNVDN